MRNKNLKIPKNVKLHLLYTLKGYNYFRSFFNNSIKNNPSYKSLSKEIIRKYNRTRIRLRQSKFCYAPYNNLYFSFEGKVLSCCYNRKHILGTYPEQSIRQIWNGVPLLKLREYISYNDLSFGCESCLHKITEGAFDTVWAKKFDEIPVQKNYPSQLDFELSNSCNLECIMCSGEYSSLIRRNIEKLKPQKNPYDDNFIVQLEEFIPHLSKANFLGGEPFLIDIYYKIWEKIIEINPGCQIVIQTNASFLNDKIKSIIQSGNFSFNISIDSIKKETYEKIRVHADFNKTIQNIEYLISYTKKKNSFIGFSVCPMQQNWKELPEMIKYCNEKDIPVVFNRVWYPPHCALWNLPEEQLSGIYNYLSQYSFHQKTISQKKNSLQYQDLLNQVHYWKIESHSKNEKRKALEYNSPEELFALLIQKIKTEQNIKYVDQENQKIIIRLNKLMQNFKDEKNYKTLLIKIIEIPVDILIREFTNNSDERLLEQAKQFMNET